MSDMELEKDEFTGEMRMRHGMCQCGRGRAIFGEGDDAHCIKCTWGRTGYNNSPGGSNKARYGKCPKCGRVVALFMTGEGRMCHWCRSELNAVEVVEEPEPEPEEEESTGPPMEELQCSYCGTSFERKASQVRKRRKEGQENFYCGQDCFHRDRQVVPVL